LGLSDEIGGRVGVAAAPASAATPYVSGLGGGGEKPTGSAPSAPAVGGIAGPVKGPLHRRERKIWAGDFSGTVSFFWKLGQSSSIGFGPVRLDIGVTD